jgi:hypothetical protein
MVARNSCVSGNALLRGLDHEGVGISEQGSLQGDARLDRLQQIVRRYALAVACHLHERLMHRAVAVVAVQHERQAGHAFAADHADFDGVASVGDDRGEARLDEVSVGNALVARFQLLSDGQVDCFEVRLEQA